MIAIVLGPGMIGHGFMTWAHHYVDVSVTSMLTLASPLVTILGAWLLFDETLGRCRSLGGAIVLGSARFPRARASAAPARTPPKPRSAATSSTGQETRGRVIASLRASRLTPVSTACGSMSST